MPLTGDLKEAGLTHWISPNYAKNESGFTALPGGFRNGNSCVDIGERTYWWTTSRNNTGYGTLACGLIYTGQIVLSGYNKEMGFSARCVEDN